MKPAGKLKLWTGGYVNRPGVEPPVVLRIVLFCLLLLSLFTLVYGAVIAMGFGNPSGTAVYNAGLVALFFLLPFVIAYLISTNHPSSRPLLVVFFVGVGIVLFPANPSVEAMMERPIFFAALALFTGILYWLYGSARARVYYALIRGKPIPDDLAHLVDQLVSPTATEKLARRVWAFFEPLSPFFLIGFALLIVYAGFANLTP